MTIENEKKVLFLTGFSHFYSHFYLVVFPTMILWMHKDFNLGIAETINLGFYMYLLFGLMALPMGALSDLWNSKSLLIVFLIGSGVSSILAGLSDSPKSLMFALTLMGVSTSIYHPVGMGLISKTCKNRGRALGINGICGNLGIGSGPFITGLIAYYFSWKVAYIVFGIPTIIVGILLFFANINENSIEVSNVKINDTGKQKAVINFVIILACMMLIGLCYRGTMIVLPTIFEQKVSFASDLISKLGDIKLSASKTVFATVLVSFVYIVGIFGQMFGGKIADKYDLRVGYFAFHLISLPFMFLMATVSNVAFFFSVIVYLFFSLGMQPIENSLIAKLTPPKLRGTSYGLKFFSTMGVGALAVKLSKYVITNQEITNLFYYQAGFIVLVLFGIIIFWRKTKLESIKN